MNDESVKNIKFIRPDGTFKIYDTSTGSKAYSEFKKDFRESTAKVEKMGKFKECKVVVESSGSRSKLNGFKFSDFGVADDFDSDSKTIVIKESVIKNTAPEDPTSKKKLNESKVVKESTVSIPDPKDNGTKGITLELGEVDPVKQVQALLASMNKYNGFEKDKPNADFSVDAGVSTYPDIKDTVKVSDEVVTEAEGDDEPDPFAGGDDAGGGGDDAGGGGDAGGDADPFGGGDDAGGGDAGEGGPDAGGEGGDPFGGGDAGGGDAGGGDAGGDPFGGGDAAGDAGGDEGGDMGADGGDESAGEPGAPDAVNTDAQGNEKSQYNINVTRPFNSEDSFDLNEEEQKEFFGKIDQLVKIPDMDNYSLYLYQITPENMNLDDVHYIEALYQLSVKLGLLEDIYADSNLLEKYNSYKYSVVKDGEGSEEDELNV